MIRDRTGTAGSIVMTVAESADPDPAAAARILIGELDPDAALYALFVTAGYPRVRLAAALAQVWGDRLIGCTSAGNIGPGGFVATPVVGIALSGGGLQVQTLVVQPISDLEAALEGALPELERLRRTEPGRESFALMLVDGSTAARENVAAELKPLLGDIPLIGASAGADPSDAETAVLARGVFGNDRATVTVLSTTAPFRPFRMQHYRPGERVLVITAASPVQHLVHEIDGRPAAEAYAEALGVPVSELGPEQFSSNPVLLRAAGQDWVRSISGTTADGSLQFIAAIDTGAVLRLGSSRDAAKLLRVSLDAIAAEMDVAITGVLAFDCILRRVDFNRSGLNTAVSRAMSEYRVVGFNTHGEHFEDFHMNQSMVGVVFGD